MVPTLMTLLHSVPFFLGSAAFDVYSKGIYQQSNAQQYDQPTRLTSVAAKYGSAYAEGTDFIINGFTAAEPGLYYGSCLPCTEGNLLLQVFVETFFHYIRSVHRVIWLTLSFRTQVISLFYLMRLISSMHGTQRPFWLYRPLCRIKTRKDELHGELRDGKSLVLHSAYILTDRHRKSTVPSLKFQPIILTKCSR